MNTIDTEGLLIIEIGENAVFPTGPELSLLGMKVRR
jgi:hypothetical protein